MTKRFGVPTLISIAASLTFAVPNVLACMCMGAEGKTMRDVAVSSGQGENADKLIFEGLVEAQELKTGPIGAPENTLSMTTAGTHRAVSLRVLRAYRGIASERIVVLTGMGLGDCGFDFESGKEYLVYADRIDANTLFTSICTGTAPLEHAGPALRYLRGEPPTPDDLLDPQKYQDKFFPHWYGTACGRVTKPDGTSLSKADVDMTGLRYDPFPPARAGDPDLSKPNGSFCITGIVPGKYLLKAETTNYDDSTRWMGYYPGVARRSEAVPIEIRAGEKLANLQFTVNKQRLYTVRFRIVASDCSPLPLNTLGVAIDSPDQDGLAYHLRQNRNDDGVYPAGYVPPGHYVVQTYIEPNFDTGAVPAELAKWKMAKQEVDISPTGLDIALKLTPVN